MSNSGCDISEQLLSAIDELMEVDRLGYEDREMFAKHVLQRFPQRISVSRFLSVYRSQLIAGYPRKEAVCSMIERLKPHYRLGVVSNGRVSSQLPKMCKAGFCPGSSTIETTAEAESASAFETIVISEEVGFEKPARAPFDAVLQRIGLPAESSLYIGDNPWHDIAGATAVGMQTCWVALSRSFPDDIPPPDLVIDSILDLEGILPLD